MLRPYRRSASLDNSISAAQHVLECAYHRRNLSSVPSEHGLVVGEPFAVADAVAQRPQAAEGLLGGYDHGIRRQQDDPFPRLRDPGSPERRSGCARAGQIILIAAGWILATTIAAGITRTLRRLSVWQGILVALQTGQRQ